MPFITSLVALIKKKPFVFTLHGYPKLKGKRAFFQFLYRIFIASVFLRIAKKVIVVSKNSVDDIRGELDTNKISYIPNGINPEDFEGVNEGGDTITYIGKLNEDKGIETLLSAYSRIKEKYPLGLLIVGEDDGSKEKLENLARKLNIEPSFLEVPYSKMKEVYKRSRAIVLPSKYEGLSLVWLESIASGKPMFSTPVGDAKHLFEQLYGSESESFLFQNEDELTKKLKDFLSSQNDFQKTIKKAEYMCKEEYSWDNVSSLTRHAYEGVLEQ
jgi:glycosyltransferase involved in cell wall biosynthesis